MSRIRPLLTTVGIAATTGATLALGTIGAAPANAAQLEFTFSTRAGGTGSFTLDTSIPDSNPSIDEGLFQNAITNFQYSSVGFSEPLNVQAGTPSPGPRTNFQVIGRSANNTPLFRLGLDFINLSLAERLSDNPADYSPSFVTGSAGSFAGYGGGFESLPGGDYEGTNVGFFSTGVTSVTAQKRQTEPVPEPNTILGSLLGLNFLGMLWIKKRLQHRQRT